MKRMLSLSEAAELTNRSLKAVQQLVSRGSFPCSKIAGRLCVDPDELTRFLELSKKTTAEQAVARQGEA